MSERIASDDAGWLVAGSSSPHEVRQYYDDLAADYDATLDRWGYTAPAMAAELLLASLTQVTPATTVLDAGCGTGLAGEALRAAGYGGRLLGIDLSPSSIELAAQRRVYDSVETADLQRPLNIAERSLDAVVCVGVLTYLPDVLAIWSELCRVVRPGGVIVCTQRDDLWEKRACDAALDQLEQAGRWSAFHLTNPRSYLPGNEEFADRILVRFLAARVH